MKTYTKKDYKKEFDRIISELNPVLIDTKGIFGNVYQLDTILGKYNFSFDIDSIFGKFENNSKLDNFNNTSLLSKNLNEFSSKLNYHYYQIFKFINDMNKIIIKG